MLERQKATATLKVPFATCFNILGISPRPLDLSPRLGRRRLSLLATTAIVAASALIAGADDASAQTYTWGGTGSSTATTDYNLNTNWSNPASAPPAAGGQSAVFANTGSGTVIVTAPVAPDSWTFNANAQAFDISGSAVNFGTAAGLTNNSSNSLTISNSLGGASATLTQNGSGVLTLKGSSSYNGGTAINAGTVRLENNSALGSNAVTIEDGATLDYQNGRIIGNDITISSGFANFSQTGSVARQQGTIFGSGGLRKVGGGELELTGNGYTGGTIIQSGGIAVDSNFALGDGSVTLLDNTRLRSINNRTIANDISIADGANAFFDSRAAGQVLTLSGAFALGTSAASVAHFGRAATATTVNLNSSSGTAVAGSSISVDGGILRIGSAGAVNVLQQATGGTTIAGGATLDLNAFNVVLGSLAGAGTVLNDGGAVANLTVGGNDLSTVFTGTIVDGSDPVSLSKVGTGALTLGGLNTFTGGTTISGGALRLAGGTLGTGSIVFSGNGTLAVDSNAALTNNISINNGASATFGAAPGQTFTINSPNFQIGASAGTALRFGSVIDTGTVLFNPTAFAGTPASGVVSVDGGTLKLGSSAAGTFLGGANGGLTVASGATYDLNGFNGSAVNLFGAGVVTNSGGAASTMNVVQPGTSTFSGVIQDGANATALDLSGAGTLILSGTNTYSGGTNIASGTLQLGNGGNSGSIIGNVTNDGAFVVNRSDTYTFAGIISGSGSFRQIGSGTTVLTGVNTYTGPTTVSAGTLSVNGSVVSAVTVNNGGTLGGTGSVGNTIINSGATIAPGNSIGTLNVNGNLTIAANSTFQVEANAAGQSDKIAATGTATINGGTVQVLAVNGAYNPSTTYPILTASSVTGTFANVTSNLAFLTASLIYKPSEVDLVLALANQPNPNPNPNPGPTTPGGLFTAAAQTFNQRGVAGALDVTLISNPVVAALLLQTLPNALLAFDQLSGEVHPSTTGVLLDESRYPRDAILGRLRQASYGGNTQMAALTTGGPMAFSADGRAAIEGALAYAKSPIVTKAPPMTAPTYDVTFWAQGFGAWGRFDTDANAASVRRDLAGFISGVDTRVGSNGRLGVAAGYTASKNMLDARGAANVDTGHVAGYGGWNFGAFNLRAGGAYAFHTIDTDRTIAFPGFFDRATAHYDGHTGQVFGEFGYGFAMGNLAVEPFAGAAWVSVKTDAAAERGGAAALNFGGTTFETGYSTLGIRAAGMVPLSPDTVLIPRGSLAWQHAFDGVAPLAVLAFQAAPVPFAIAGVPIARDALLAEAGLDLAIGRSVTLGVSYTGQLASSVQDHAVKGKFSWRF